MTSWTKHDRFNATLSGERADRPPVTAWRHFVDAENDAASLAEATASFTRAWDWDWVKLNPRATYYAEAWGSTFDADDYRDVLPRQLRAAVERPSDLAAIGVLSPAASAALSEQLTAARLVRAALPDVPVTETLFSPLSVLLQLAGLPLYAGGVIYGSTPSVTLAELLTADRSAVHHALHAIALTLADFATTLVSPEVGLDGIFYAVTGTASPGLIDEATFRELSRPYDEIVLSAASGASAGLTSGRFTAPRANSAKRRPIASAGSTRSTTLPAMALSGISLWAGSVPSDACASVTPPCSLMARSPDVPSVPPPVSRMPVAYSPYSVARDESVWSIGKYRRSWPRGASFRRPFLTVRVWLAGQT